MKTGWLIAATLLFSFLLGFPFRHNAQDTPAQADNSQHANRSQAIGLLRAINTAEMAYRNEHGMFASWPTLLVAGSLQTEQSAGRQVRLADGRHVLLADSQIPSGWKLRFNLTADGQGYDVLLEDTTDEEQGYAVLTDESGLIRECKALR